MMATVVAFFGLLWFGVVVMGMSPGITFVVSLFTLTLVGIGIMFTRTTFRRQDDDR
jgi:hypothetical protein